MGNTLYTKISFQDVSFAIENPSSFILINTLPITKQHCLIKNTIPSINEETIVNHYLSSNKNINIIVYGANSSDNDIEIMSKRSKKAKTEKIAEFDHELGIKIHNEPHLEDFYRAEYAEKVAKIK